MNDLTKKAEATKTVIAPAKVAENGKSVATPSESKNPLFEEKKKELDKILNPISVDTRIKSVGNLQKLVDKHLFLKEKADDLTAFNVSRDGLKEKITITGDNNNIIEISNTVVIDKILFVCENTLDELLVESEEQIVNFKI